MTIRLEDGKLCLSCQKGRLHRKYENRTVKVLGKEKTLEHLTLYKCNECSDGFYDSASEELVEQVILELREEAKQEVRQKREEEGLLTSREISDLRSCRSVTQEFISCIIGMSAKTIARYESDLVVQSKNVDLILCMIRDVPGAFEYLRSRCQGVLEAEPTKTPLRAVKIVQNERDFVRWDFEKVTGKFTRHEQDEHSAFEHPLAA